MYNDKEALERCLTKIHHMGITGLVVDGRFEDFPQINNSDYSTDGTQAFKQAVNCHYYNFPVGREQDKFNFALEKARELHYKVFMYCGADAYFEADMPEFMINLQRLYEQYAVEPSQLTVQAEELQPDAKWNNTATRQPRIILNYWKMEARHLHWTMYEKDAPDTKPLAPVHELVEGIKLFHDNTIRPKERDDMMTAYQNHNVPREREMFMNNVVPKAYEKVNILRWNIGTDGSYEQARDVFFGKNADYSHILIISEGYEVTDAQMRQFESLLEERNNTMMQLPLITAVWTSKTAKNHFTLNPDDQIKSKWPKYPKIQALYSPDGLPMEGDPILVAPYTAGPVICMGQRAVQLVEHMGDNLDFLAILLGLGIQMHADSRIQF